MSQEIRKHTPINLLKRELGFSGGEAAERSWSPYVGVINTISFKPDSKGFSVRRETRDIDYTYDWEELTRKPDGSYTYKGSDVEIKRQIPIVGPSKGSLMVHTEPITIHRFSGERPITEELANEAISDFVEELRIANKPPEAS